MDYQDARHQLLLHGAGTTDAAGEPLVLSDGFLASLRPYRGLHEKNLHLVMEALFVVGERIHDQPQTDRELLHSLWWMCSMARRWGLEPAGMLQRNQLITPEDTGRLAIWIDLFEGTSLHLLCGWPSHWAVDAYAEYITTFGWWNNVESFIPLLCRAIADPKFDSLNVQAVSEALAKLGRLAASVLPSLREAELRDRPLYAETNRDSIRLAIQAIEKDVAEGG